MRRTLARTAGAHATSSTCMCMLQVLARSSPEDKLTLVALLKHHGEVVAVTGA